MVDENGREFQARSNSNIEHQLFISLADNSAEFFGISDLTLKPVYVNPAGLRLVGLDSFEQAAQASVTAFFFPEDQTFIKEEFFPRIERDGAGETEIRFRHFKTGEPLWMIYSVFLVKDETGAPIGYTTISRDITGRVKTEENLRRTQQETERERRLYETIFSNTPDLIYVFDLNHRFTYANKILLEMWGKTWDEAIGKNCLELGYEKWHAEMHDREIEQVRATRQPIRGEVPFSGTFGRRMYDYIFVPIIGADGEVEAVAGTTRDVTERKQSELYNRFIMQIDEAVRPLETPEEITLTLARLLGEYLGADRCAYAEVEADEDHFYIPGDYTRGDTHSIVGRYSMASFGKEVLRLMRENKPYVVADVDHDPQVTEEDLAAYRQTAIQAVICVPLHKNGRFAACMAVHQRQPRNWTPEEI